MISAFRRALLVHTWCLNVKQPVLDANHPLWCLAGENVHRQVKKKRGESHCSHSLQGSRIQSTSRHQRRAKSLCPFMLANKCGVNTKHKRPKRPSQQQYQLVRAVWAKTLTETQKRLCDFLPQSSGGKKQSKHELNSLFNDSLCANNRSAAICGNLI